MKWAEFRVHTTQEAIEPVSNVLHESGAAGVAIEDPHDLVQDWGDKFGEMYDLSPDDYPEEGVYVKAYFPMNDSFSATMDLVKDRILQLTQCEINLGQATMEYVEVDDEDWANAWKKYYHPVQVTERVIIVPTWEDYQAQENDIIIELDPGMAFGTGTHPTTILSIRALEQTVEANDRVIDVGTGSGVLALAAWKFGAQTITAYDLDQVAVTSAKENLVLNQADHAIEVKQNNLLEGVQENVADVIVANILAEVIVSFADEAFKVVKPGGSYITSGIITRKKADVIDALESAGFIVDEVTELNDWVAIKARKPV
ncbi:ribosomal protein L11 methyltransferase [Alkalihalobacillus xiaoxiensis]|uniref:Ribosomal protein L11 methyltransferase n=1 Tax=Shouchella xiaoxiensis TaxID=766895 RepID=A0ABS2SRE2_9BACI|nr:50S ribosomal protein L11 methyltransferase [Shouchella xiaoxiensis]MBM7838082.1 ribosomal protein L11 methyltransferase [Shouchella xiaoxiensis]